MLFSHTNAKNFCRAASDAVLSLFFPRRCAFCEKVIPESDICGECDKTVMRIEYPVCHLCGVGKKFCTCKSRSRHYDAVAAPFYYEGLVKSSIHRYKFCGETDLARFFSDEIAETVAEAFGSVSFDCVVCVPMTRDEKRRRSYNQGALLARGVARALELDFRPDALVKLYGTPSQRELSAEERIGNVSGVFEASNPALLQAKTILLCDDVKTTGATFNECAKALKLNGAAAVYCAAFAIARKQFGKEEVE